MARDGGKEPDTVEKYTFGEYVVEIRFTVVPVSENWPDGIRYSFHYGTTADETVFRYDNADHPGAPHHHKHTREGNIVGFDFNGVEPLYDRFKEEVHHEGHTW